MKRWVRRSELAKILGTTSPTVKYYTSLGFFPVQRKTDHGQYLYDWQMMKLIYDRIMDLKAERYTIEEIKETLIAESKQKVAV
jgi:DNA-binding transcriptional MerR regulator